MCEMCPPSREELAEQAAAEQEKKQKIDEILKRVAYHLRKFEIEQLRKINDFFVAWYP